MMKIPPSQFSLEERVAMAARCRDADPIPKVADAGRVFEDASGQRIQVMHNGLRVLADGYYGKWMTDLIRICRGHHESQEERLFHEVEKRLPQDARMIELGGFWSYYSLWFLQDQPKRQAVVIEPEPNNLAVGRANARLNDLSPKFMAGFAGSSFEPEASFQAEYSGHVRIPSYSVPYLMEQEGWSRLDLLHLDVQGAETAVLEGCMPLFQARRIDWVFVSTHHHVISGDPLTHQRCLSMLREAGAVIEAEHDVFESFSGDGLIVARFCSAPPGWVPVHLSTNRASQSLFRDPAYDLHESYEAGKAHKGADSVSLHPSLRKTGDLLTLNEDGPLGKAGECLLLPGDKMMSPSVREHALWDAANLNAFCAHLDANRSYTLVDVGANVGLFTRQLLNRTSNIEHVLCVEPDVGNFRALQYNLSGFEAARLHNLALGDSDGERTFFRDLDNIGNYSLNSDAMRERPFDVIEVEVKEAGAWLSERLAGEARLLWKSDTQGWDELIVSRVPMHIWDRVDVALMEMWRINKPAFDREQFRARLDAFPHKQLGEETDVSSEDILDYLNSDDWQFVDLLLWR